MYAAHSHEILFTTHTYLTFVFSLINADGRIAAVDPPLGSSYSPDPSFPPLSRPAHTGRVWEPNQPMKTNVFTTLIALQKKKSTPCAIPGPSPNPTLNHLANKPQQTTRTLFGLIHQVRDGLLYIYDVTPPDPL